MVTYYITPSGEDVGFVVMREGQPKEYSSYLGTHDTYEHALEVVQGYIAWQGGKLHGN